MDETQKKFGQIYDDHIEKIYRFVFLRVNSREIAQDLASETFTKCWESYKTNPAGIRNPRAFLYKTAKNLVIDHYRRKSKIQTVPPEEVETQLADNKIDFQHRAVLASDMAMVQKAIAGLSEDYQNAIIWHYLDDLSVSEVAQLLDRSPAATRVLLHRAIKELKTRLV